MKICYVTTYDASDRRQWSGLGAFIARALQAQGAEIDYCGSLVNKRSLLAKAEQQYCQRVAGKVHLRGRELWQLENYARQVKNHIAKTRPDLIFSPGTIPIALLDCDKPIVTWTDATFGSLVDFYPGYSKLCGHTLRDGHSMEKAALERCKLAIFSSDWAARSAVERYAVRPEKVKTVPFGPNFENLPLEKEVEAAIEARPFETCRLLFVASEWQRKGGDYVLATVRELEIQGIPTELTLIGCAPPSAEKLPDGTRGLGFLDKNSAQDAAKLREEFLRAHFLLLPSRAECCAVVLAEAMAFGVPAIASDVGGNATLVHEGANGRMVPLSQFVESAAGYVRDLHSKPERYRELARSCRAEYESRLKWECAGERVSEFMAGVI